MTRTNGGIGGLIGNNTTATAIIQYCNANGDVAGTYYTGGLIGSKIVQQLYRTVQRRASVIGTNMTTQAGL